MAWLRRKGRPHDLGDQLLVVRVSGAVGEQIQTYNHSGGRV